MHLLARAAFLVLLALSLPHTVNAETQPLRIGFIGPLSGPAAAYGVAARNGIQLALEDISAERGVSAPLQIWYEDDRFEAKQTVAAFKRLHNLHGLHLVISIASTPSKALAPVAQAANVPLLAWASDASVAAGRTLVIRTYPSGADEGRHIARAAASRDYHAVAVAFSVNDYTRSVRDGFIEAFSKDRVAIEEELPGVVDDFRPFLLKAKARGADSFFLCVNPGQSGVFARQARDLGLTGPIFGCENLNNLEEYKASRGALEGAWMVTVGVTNKFRDRYRARFNDDSILSAAAIHYDMIKQLAGYSLNHPVAQDLVQQLIDSPASSGAIRSADYKQTPEDRFLDVALIVQTLKGGVFVPEQE